MRRCRTPFRRRIQAVRCLVPKFGCDMRRRDFAFLVVGAAVWPFIAHAQRVRRLRRRRPGRARTSTDQRRAGGAQLGSVLIEARLCDVTGAGRALPWQQIERGHLAMKRGGRGEIEPVVAAASRLSICLASARSLCAMSRAQASASRSVGVIALRRHALVIRDRRRSLG